MPLRRAYPEEQDILEGDRLWHHLSCVHCVQVSEKPQEISLRDLVEFCLVFFTRLGAPCITKNYAQLRVIRSLQTFAESAPQIILQSYILLRTWQGIGKRSFGISGNQLLKMNTLSRLRLDSPGVRGNQHLDDGEEFGRAPLPRGQWEEEDTHHEGGLGFLLVLPSDRASKVSERATTLKSQKLLSLLLGGSDSSIGHVDYYCEKLTATTN